MPVRHLQRKTQSKGGAKLPQALKLAPSMTRPKQLNHCSCTSLPERGLASKRASPAELDVLHTQWHEVTQQNAAIRRPYTHG